MNFGQCWRVFVKTIRTSYEHLGKVLLINIIWFLVSLAPFLVFLYFPIANNIGFLITLILTIIAFGGATGAIQYVFSQILEGEYFSFNNLWQGFKRFIFRGSVLLLLVILGFSILIFNIWFSRAYPSMLFLILSGFWIWGLVYLYAFSQLIFPILVQEDLTVLQTLKRAALLLLDNPLAGTMLLIMSLFMVILSVFLVGVPFLILTASFLSILQNYFYSELMVKYIVEAEEEQREDTGE